MGFLIMFSIIGCVVGVTLLLYYNRSNETTGKIFGIWAIIMTAIGFFMFIGMDIAINERKASSGEIYEISVRIGDKIVVADKNGERVKITTPEEVFIDKDGVAHIVSLGQVFTVQDIIMSKEGKTAIRK